MMGLILTSLKIFVLIMDFTGEKLLVIFNVRKTPIDSFYVRLNFAANAMVMLES